MLIDWIQLHSDVFAGKRVLVTGGAGFIGSHLCEALVQLGAEVVALDDLSGGAWSNLNGFGDRVSRMTASILDVDALSEAAAGCAFIFHQAALGSVPRSTREPALYYRVNVTGTLNVMQSARDAGVERVVFAGSSSAYGDPPGDADTAKVETMPALPRSPYAAAKLAGEHTLRAWSHSFGVDSAVLRYFNIFGPRQNANSAYAAVIAAFAKALHTGTQPTIYGDGEQSRDFTFVGNAVHANLLAARAEGPIRGEVFNVACGVRVSVNRLYEAMAELWDGDPARPNYEPARAGDVKHSLADIAKGRSQLGYEPLVDFESGLNATVQWYRDSMSGESTA